MVTKAIRPQDAKSQIIGHLQLPHLLLKADSRADDDLHNIYGYGYQWKYWNPKYQI